MIGYCKKYKSLVLFEAECYFCGKEEYTDYCEYFITENTPEDAEFKDIKNNVTKN